MWDKYMFGYAAQHSRCLIWLDGFYENQHVGNGRKTVPYFIHMPGNELFAVGGLWSRWQNPADGEVFNTCALVTIKANELMSEIHNSKKRMPLVLLEEVRGVWLNHALRRSEVAQIAVPLKDGLLIADKLSAEVVLNHLQLF